MSTISHPFRPWSDRLLQRGHQPRLAALFGAAAVVVITLALVPVADVFGRSTLGLMLVVPVVAAAVIGGRWPAYLVAALAGFAFSLRLPPIGSFRIAVAEDLAALIVFFGVAVVVSTLVSGRIQALTRLERDRTVLLRSVSHDLRTPLGTIRGAATEMLDQEGGGPDLAMRNRLLHLIDSEAQRLDRLVANLLSLSRIEANAMAPDRQSVDLVDLARRAGDRAGQFRDGVTVTVANDAIGSLPTLYADYVQVDQMLSNLLENAVRHSPDHGTVQVSLTADQHQVMIHVADRGPGVSPDEVKAIFQPFRSGEIAGSSGVGLAICRAIARAHGGTITVHDRPGGGAEFVVALPLA